MKNEIINPFAYHSEKKLLFFGIGAALFGSTLAYLFNARFDGVLDLHFVKKTKFYEPAIDLIVNAFCLVFTLFLIGKFLNYKTRIIDIITAVLISKIPYYLLVFQNLNNFQYSLNNKLIQPLNTKNYSNVQITTSEIAYLVFCGILTLFALLVYIILLYNGFKTATNAKKLKPIFWFSMALLLSEIVSKIIISKFN